MAHENKYIFAFQSFKRFTKMIHSTNQRFFFFLFTTPDFKKTEWTSSCSPCSYFFFFFFQTKMLASLAIPEKNSKMGILVIGAA